MSLKISYFWGMFVKTIVKSNTKGGKRFYHYRLVESYRMNGKPRHRTLLNLGAIPLLDDAPIKRKQLANRIEDLVNGNHQLFPSYLEVELEELALKYHTELIAYHWSGGSSKDSAAANNTEQADYQSVDVNSLAHDLLLDILQKGKKVIALIVTKQLTKNKL